MAIGIFKIAIITAPERFLGRAQDRCPKFFNFFQNRLNLLFRQGTYDSVMPENPVSVSSTNASSANNYRGYSASTMPPRGNNLRSSVLAEDRLQPRPSPYRQHRGSSYSVFVSWGSVFCSNNGSLNRTQMVKNADKCDDYVNRITTNSRSSISGGGR